MICHIQLGYLQLIITVLTSFNISDHIKTKKSLETLYDANILFEIKENPFMSFKTQLTPGNNDFYVKNETLICIRGKKK